MELKEFMNKNSIKDYKGFFMRDDRPRATTGSFIFNLLPNGSGSHWVALRIVNDRADYFDSYAAPPPQKILQFMRDHAKKVYINRSQLQAKGTLTCGYFCTHFVWWMYNGRSHYDFIETEYDANRREDNEKKIAEIFS